MRRAGLVAWVGILRLRHDFALRSHGSAQDDNSCKDTIEDRDQSEEEDDFVELGGVARDAVAEIDGPGERGGRAVSVVGEAGEETSDAADSDAESERDGVEVAGGLVESDVAFDQFDGDQASGECADNGFAADQVGGIVQAVQGELRVFEQV
jgi:hypothetical protein